MDNLTNIEGLVSFFKELTAAGERLHELSLNTKTENHRLLVKGKIVLNIDNEIIKVHTRIQTYQRLKVQSIFPAFFLPEEIIYQDKNISITKQPLLAPLDTTECSDEALKYVKENPLCPNDTITTTMAAVYDLVGQKMYNKISSICRTHNIFGLHANNIGVKDGVPYAYDWLTSLWWKEDKYVD